MSKYVEGTIFQARNGYVFIKKNGKPVPYGRHVVEVETGGALAENVRVFHMDGDKANNDPSNLAPITFSGIRYNLASTKILYMPKLSKNRQEKVSEKAIQRRVERLAEAA